MARYNATDGTMCFATALEQIKRGERVARQGWNGKGMWLALNRAKGATTVYDRIVWASDFIVMKTADEHLVPWAASQTDLLAEDWVTVYA